MRLELLRHSRLPAALGFAIAICAPQLSVQGQEGSPPASAAPPDFYGVWGRNRFEFEQPHSGPGPVTETSEVVGIIAGDYTNPILQPWAAEVIRARVELAQTGLPIENAHNACRLEGVPYVFAVREMQIVQGPTQVVLLYNADHQYRIVELNTAHPENLEPSWFGHSVGHYEGDTLVIDTIGIKATEDTQVDRFGTPHTEALHVVERYRLVDSDSVVRDVEPERRRENARGLYEAQEGGKTLELAFTVEDQGAFTMPWGALVRSNRVQERDLMLEHVCAENNRDFFRDELFPVAPVEPDF